MQANVHTNGGIVSTTDFTLTNGVFGAGRGYNITEQWRVYADYAAEISGEIYHNVNAGIQFSF